MMKTLKPVLYASFAAFLGGATQAAAADLEIIQPWVRINPAPRTGALYFTLHNGGPAADRLVSAATPLARRSELHASIEESSVARMEKMEGIEISAGGSVALRPGGLHIMLTGLDAAVAPGQVLSVVLRFQRAGEVTVHAPVLGPGEPAPSPASRDPHGMQGGRHGHGAHESH